MARASFSSMKIYSHFPRPIILFYTKSIIIPVCRLRLVGYLLKLGLAVNQAYLCRETKYGAHQAFVVLQGGAFVISGLPGDGAFVARLFKYSEFHIFTAKFLLISLVFKKKALHILIKREISQFKSHVLLFY